MEVIIISIFVGFIAYKLYVYLYFKSSDFISIKDKITKHTKDCNELNEHIENLKQSYFDFSSFDYGEGALNDSSRYNMRRKNWHKLQKNSRTHICSATVCKNASIQPFKYLFKYFNIDQNETTLSRFEEALNNFSAVEQGKFLLIKERDKIVTSIENFIPKIIMKFEKKKLFEKLGFNHIDLTDFYFPVYSFQYVSSGGNSSFKSDIKLNVETLDRLISFLSSSIKFRKSVAGQRALMTSALREKIKTRDNFTCKICSLSIYDEKNLLLEIDHVVPLSKGGITSEKNLQTLCWKCNRSKGAKFITDCS